MSDLDFESYVERRDEIQAVQFKDQSQAADFARALGAESWSLNNYPNENFELILQGGEVVRRGDYLVRESSWVQPSIVRFQGFREKWQKKV